MKNCAKHVKYFLLCLMPVFCFPQAPDSAGNAILKLNLISMLDVNTFATIQIAFEKQLHSNFSVQGEAGYGRQILLWGYDWGYACKWHSDRLLLKEE